MKRGRKPTPCPHGHKRANIAGKYLKAEQLQLAREIFFNSLGRRREADEVIDGMITPKRIAETA